MDEKLTLGERAFEKMMREAWPGNLEVKFYDDGLVRVQLPNGYKVDVLPEDLRVYAPRALVGMAVRLLEQFVQQEEAGYPLPKELILVVTPDVAKQHPDETTWLN